MSNRRSTAEIDLRGLKTAHLRLMAELQATGQLGQAAARMGLAQPAASRLLAEVERLIGHPVHAREGRSLRLTRAGEALARRAQRIQMELADAAREVSEAAAGAEGHVRIGAVTGPALDRVLPAITAARASHPEMTVEVVVQTSEPLCELLRAGKLDFAIGRLISAGSDRSLAIEMIGEEPLDLIVRSGHPLLDRYKLDPGDALAFDWVMPEDDTLLTRTVLDRLQELGLPPPRRQVATSSFLFTLALLRATDAVAPLSAAVVESFAFGPALPFARLDLDLRLRVAPFGLIRRRGSDLTPAAARLLDAVMAAGGPMPPTPAVLA